MIARKDTICLIIAITAQLGWKIYHLNVKSNFLNCELEEEIYVDQLEGYKVKVYEDTVYKLKKALYGLK